MKIFILILLLLIIPILILPAYDDHWGIGLNLGFDLPEIQGSTLSINQKNNLVFWYKGSWNLQSNIEFAGGLDFNTSWNFGMDIKQNFQFNNFNYTFYPTFHKLIYYGTSGQFTYRVGRQNITDPALLIINSTMDGIHASYEKGKSIFSAGLGFTGLTFGQSSGYYMTNTDAIKYSDSFLSAPRLVEYASWEMPSAALLLNPAIYFVAVQDFTSSYDLDNYQNDRIHTFYLELLNRGFIGESFIFEIALIAQWGIYGNSNILAGMGNLSFSYRPNIRNRLGIELMAASGDDWNRSTYLLGKTEKSELNQYLPVSSVKKRSYVLELELGNVSSLALFYNASPSDVFSWEVRTTTFFRNAIGPVSSSIFRGDTGHFLGQELQFGFFWQPKSDFGWKLKTGLLLPGESIVLDTYLARYAYVIPRVGFSFTFRF